MEFNLELKSTLLHVILGGIIGFMSGIFSKDPYQLSNISILSLMLIVLIIMWPITQRGFKLRTISTEQKKYNFKWYLSNGVYPYIIFWIFIWIIVYNL